MWFCFSGKPVSPKCYVFFVEMAKRDDDTVRYLTDSEKEEVKLYLYYIN